MKTFKHAFTASLPMLFGYLSVGLTFGLLCVASGYQWYIALASSAVLYAGAAQFVCVDLFAHGGGIWQSFMLALLMNLRHIAYGIALREKFDGLKARPYLAYALSDETFAVLDACRIEPDVDRGRFYVWVTLLDQCYWVAGTMLGVFAASLVRFNTKGMDFTLTALFVVSFLSQWESADSHWPALIGLGCGAVMLFALGPADMVAPALALMTVLLFAFRGRIEGGEAHP